MKTIIISAGVSNRVLSSEYPFPMEKTSLGCHDIGRLMGEGRDLGAGPLPVFLRHAIGSGARVILLRDSGHEKGAQIIPQLADLVGKATIIETGIDEVPWQRLQQEFDQDTDDVRFLVIGAHTERQVSAIATLLRKALGRGQVAVAAHLTGSSTKEAHYAALRHNLPIAGIEVLLDLEEVARYCGIDSEDFQELDCHPCVLGPDEYCEQANEDQLRILQLVCMHWTRAKLRPLAGGFSGSLLFLAEGWKGDARTEPMVMKVDDYSQMRRELEGYHLVKDFFGKHVPTFGYPVAVGEHIGVGMELAAMEGRPQTLQDNFEEADDEEALFRFLRRTDKALELLAERLYGNTSHQQWVAPFRTFGLQSERQLEWFRGNASIIPTYIEESGVEGIDQIDVDDIENILRLIVRNDDVVESEVCLVHGDLNFANAICDDGDNLWFIDWTHCGLSPVELDFAKLENDVKFVMSKDFDISDLPRMKQLEEYLLDHPIPADVQHLPASLRFCKWDLRFRKILETVRRVRTACFSLKATDDWVVYRVALLRYALHTLSFDKRRDRGECEPEQLMAALYSVEGLAYNLVSDDFHLKIRSEKPSSYPARRRISIDLAPWGVTSDYDPPYYVAPSVLANDLTTLESGWADPEDFSKLGDAIVAGSSKRRDDQGRPLNPRGRTGVSGRGLLGRWGANSSIACVVVRPSLLEGELELLLGKRAGAASLELPRGFAYPNEEESQAASRVLELETGLIASAATDDIIFEGYTYDARQTDHAWLESTVYLLVVPHDSDSTIQIGDCFGDAKWHPLNADTVNKMIGTHATFVRLAIGKLEERDHLKAKVAENLIARIK
ncbi:MAG: ADP-ribose pyrophosphatase [Planctomycetota bacterium]|jgi:ADP-ribose pyrophosphatase